MLFFLSRNVAENPGSMINTWVGTHEDRDCLNVESDVHPGLPAY
jgi:hypothetical protein